MNTAKNRKLIAAVLGLAVTALLVDKIVLGGGATPTLAADGSAAPDTTASGLPVAAKESVSATPAYRSVTTQLASMQERLDSFTGPQLVDAFAPPRALAEVMEAETARQQLMARQVEVTERSAKLRDQLQLTATVTTNRSGAMINGTFVQLGNEVTGTGFRLTKVDREGVVLEDTASQAPVRIDLNPNATGYRPAKAD